MKTLIIPFYHRNNLFDIVESIGLGEPYQVPKDVPDHVGICIKEYGYYVEAVWPRVRTRTLQEALADKDIIDKILIDVTTAEAVAILQFLQNQIGKIYSIKDIFYDIVDRIDPYYNPHPEENRWICSLLVATALQKIEGCPPLPPGGIIDPNRLYIWLKEWIYIRNSGR